MSNLIQFRRGTAAAWATANTVLLDGMPGVETDTGKLKVGRGGLAWNSLPYVSTDSGAVRIAPSNALALDTVGNGKVSPLVAGDTIDINAPTTLTIAGGAVEGGVYQGLYAIYAALTLPSTSPIAGGQVIVNGSLDLGFLYNLVFTISGKDLVIFCLKQRALVTAPGQVTGLTLGAPTNSTQPLTWTAPASNGGSAITDYKIEYKDAASGTWLVFADGVGTAAAGTVTSLASGTNYNYRVSATNAIGTGIPSSTATGATSSSSARADTATRADSSSPNPPSDGGSNWINLDTAAAFGIAGNTFVHQVSGNAEMVLAGCPADGTILASIVGDPATGFAPQVGGFYKRAGITFRCVDFNNKWQFYADYSGVCKLMRTITGTEVEIASFTHPSLSNVSPTTPWELKVVLLGTSITTFARQGGGAFVACHTTTSSQFQTATQAGILAAAVPGDGFIHLDNFSAA